MVCNKCGKELSEEARFCPQCGTSTESDTSVKEETAAEEVQENAAETAEAPETFAKAMEAATEQVAEDNTPAVTVAETEAETTDGSAVAVADKAEEAKEEETKAEETKAEETEKQEETESTAEESEKQEETAVIPVSEELAPAVVKEKKSKKGLIIGASAAAVVLAGAGVGYFGFSNEIMHFFMGDAGFAEMVEKKSIEYLYGAEIETDGMDAILADYVEQAFYGSEIPETDLAMESIDEMFSIYGDSSITLGAELNPGMLLSMADAESLLSNFKIHTVIEAVQGEECDRFSYIFTDNGARVIGADTFIQDDRLVMLMPELTSRVFTASISEMMEEAADPYETEDAEETEEKERVEFSEAEMRRIRKGIMNVYSENLKDADIEYTKEGTDLVLADCPIDSERVVIHLSADNLNSMFKEMGDFLRNDEYLRNYYVQATGEEITEYEKFFDTIEYETNAQITVETYITDHAVITGKKCILTYTGDETEGPFDVSFEITQGNFDMSMGNDNAVVSLTNRKTDETSGNMEMVVDITEIGAPFVLDVEYSGVGVAEYCGQRVETGKYIIRLSEKDQLIDFIINKESGSAEENQNGDMMADIGSGMNLSGILGMLKDIKIELNTECDGKSVNSSFTLNIPLFFDIVLYAGIEPLKTEKPVMPDYTNAINLNDDLEEVEDFEGLQKEILNNLLILAEKNELIGLIVKNSGIEDELAKLSVTESFKVHYRDYSDETRENADDVAKEICDAFFFAVEEDYENIILDDRFAAYEEAYTSGKEMKAKFYFDENGEIQVIDDGGYYFVDFGKIKAYMDKSECPENLYAEFISGALLGNSAVNVVYTDNPDDLPANLPDMYNYMDGLYQWGEGNYDNEKDNFIVGTSSELAEGVSVSERNIGDIGRCNDISETLAEEAVRFFELKSGNYFKESFVENGPESFCIVLSCSTGWGEPGTAYVNGEWTDADRLFNEPFSYTERGFQAYLNRNGKNYYIDGAWCDILFIKNNGTYEVAGVVTIPSPDNYDEISLNYYDNADVLPAAEDLVNGYYGKWNYYDSERPYKEGLFYYNGTSYAVGSYCVSTGKPLDTDYVHVTEEETDDLNVYAQDMYLLIGWLWDEYGLPYNWEMHTREFIEMSVDFDSDKMAARIFYDENGEFHLLNKGAFYFLDEQKLAAAGTGFRNVYAEIHPSSPIMSDFTVTVVSTENPDSLPSVLPDKFCFADGCFDWDENGVKDGYRVGTYPVLADGDSVLKEKFDGLMPYVEEYNGYAEVIGLAAEEFFGGKPKEFYISNTVSLLKVERINGSWSMVGFAKDSDKVRVSELFAEDISEDFISYLNEKASGGTDIYAEIFVSSYYTMPHGLNETGSYMYAGEMRVAGVSVFPSKDIKGVSRYAVPSIVDYCDSFSYGWNSEYGNMPYVSGIICGDNMIPCGTYCTDTDASLTDKEAILKYHYPEG